MGVETVAPLGRCKLNANENRNHPVEPQNGQSLWGMGYVGIDHRGQIAVQVLRGGLVGL